MPSRLSTQRTTAGLMVAALAYLATALAALPARAELGDVGFQFRISEKEMVLEYPGDMGVKMFASWDAPYQRIENRSMPFLEIMNLEESTGNLTEFSITIGDTDYNFSNQKFGDYVFLSNSTPGIPLTSSVLVGENEDGLENGDLLTVMIGDGGLAPGELVRFAIDLAPDPDLPNMFPKPDFRLILFDMNDMDENGVSDNSIVSAKFEDPNDSSMTATASTQLEDYEVTGPQADYFNAVLRPYGVMEGVDVFAATAGTTVIPEPSTAAIACLAVGGLGLWKWRRS